MINLLFVWILYSTTAQGLHVSVGVYETEADCKKAAMATGECVKVPFYPTKAPDPSPTAKP